MIKKSPAELNNRMWQFTRTVIYVHQSSDSTFLVGICQKKQVTTKRLVLQAFLTLTHTRLDTEKPPKIPSSKHINLICQGLFNLMVFFHLSFVWGVTPAYKINNAMGMVFLMLAYDTGSIWKNAFSFEWWEYHWAKPAPADTLMMRYLPDRECFLNLCRSVTITFSVTLYTHYSKGQIVYRAFCHHNSSGKKGHWLCLSHTCTHTHTTNTHTLIHT